MNSDVDIGTLPISEWPFSVWHICLQYRNNRCRCRMLDNADIQIDVDAYLLIADRAKVGPPKKLTIHKRRKMSYLFQLKFVLFPRRVYSHATTWEISWLRPAAQIPPIQNRLWSGGSTATRPIPNMWHGADCTRQGLLFLFLNFFLFIFLESEDRRTKTLKIILIYANNIVCEFFPPVN